MGANRLYNPTPHCTLPQCTFLQIPLLAFSLMPASIVSKLLFPISQPLSSPHKITQLMSLWAQQQIQEQGFQMPKSHCFGLNMKYGQLNTAHHLSNVMSATLCLKGLLSSQSIQES